MCFTCTLKKVGMPAPDLPPGTDIVFMMTIEDMCMVMMKILIQEADSRGIEMPDTDPGEDHPAAQVVSMVGRVISLEDIAEQPYEELRSRIAYAFDTHYGVLT